jgi:predicted RND superfamily exporter protein
MLKLLKLSIAYPRSVLAITGALTLLACLQIPGIRLRLDGRSLIPADHPAIAASDRASALFEARDVIVVGLAAPETGIYTPEALQLLTRLSAEIAAVPGVVPGSVTSLATIPRLFIEGDLLDLQPLLDRGDRAKPDAALGARIRRETSALGLDDGILVAADGRTAAIYAEVEPAADRGAVRHRLLKIVSRHAGGPIAIHLSGTAMAQAVLGEAAAHDLVRLVPLVLAVIAGVLLFAFRHWAPAVVSLAEIGVSLLWTVGLMGAHGQSVFVTTLVLPVILLAIGVTDDVYALNSYFAAARRAPDRPPGELAVETFSAVHRAVLTTAATTIAGLFSLLASNIEPQRVFGLYGGLSVVFSTLLTFTLVPALLVLLRPRVRPAKVSAPRFTESWMVRLLGLIRAAGPRRVLAVAAVLTAAALVLTALRLRIEDNWIDNLPPASETVRGDRALNRSLAGTNTLELMFDSGRPEGFLDPATLSALGAVEEKLAASPLIGAIQSPYDDVLRIQAALAGRDYREFRARVLRGDQRLTRPEIEQALLLLESAGNAPGMDRLEDDYRRSRMTVFVRAANYSRMGEVLDLSARAAREHLPAAPMTPFGDGWIGHLTIELLVVGQVASIGLAVLANTLLLVMLFRSLSVAALAIVPVVVSVLMVFAALAATGTPLGTANSMFAAIALGIGVDYSIHLVASYREKVRRQIPPREAMAAALTATGPAILISAAAIVGGFSVLAFSVVPPNRQLGILICLSLAVCAVVTLVVLPALLLIYEGTDREPAAAAQPRESQPALS